ncbi:MAG: DUF5591 domain-containing protein [Methanomassiliicoccales archaeon]
MFEVLDRSGPARSGRWNVGEGELRTPNLLFIDSEVRSQEGEEGMIYFEEGEFHVLSSKEEMAVLPAQRKIPLSVVQGQIDEGWNSIAVRALPEGIAVKGEGELLSLTTGFELRRDPMLLVDSLVRLREEGGHSRIIFVPGLMDVSNLALLVYLGVDLMDTSALVHQSRRGILSMPEGMVPASEMPWVVEEHTESILGLNLRMAREELNRVRWALDRGRLRELVEIRMNATPWAVAALRHFDLRHQAFQEERTPVTGDRVQCNSKQSLFRPEVVRFRDRMRDRYRPPAHKEVLLLIPCSARKPYSLSKTHRILRSRLRSVPNWSRVHEVVVTSPLGTVPRELELFFPAAHYDIPVTGDWDRFEEEMILDMVKGLLPRYRHAFLHMDGDILEGVDARRTCLDGPMSDASMDELVDRLGEVCEDLEPVPWKQDRFHCMESLLRFQMGPGAESLMEGARVVGRYPREKIVRGGEQLGMLTPERGMVSLTMEGAEGLLPLERSWVEMGDFEMKGNLFAVGVEGADPSLRVGDEALVVRRGELQAVGVAKMSGGEMVESRRGEAVRVRHHR